MVLEVTGVGDPARTADAAQVLRARSHLPADGAKPMPERTTSNAKGANGKAAVAMARQAARTTEAAGLGRPGGAAAAEAAAGEKHVDMKKLVEAARGLSQLAETLDRHLSFSVHEGSGKVVMRVVDGSSDTVIREFPPEQLLDMLVRNPDMSGVLVDSQS